MSFASVQDVAFGPFRMSLRRRILSRAEREVVLTGRAFDVLAALIGSPEAIVTKDELMRQVWGGVVVEENNLHVQIAAVRRALGAGERYIVTVHGRGYLFVGDLRPAASEAAAAGFSRSWDPAPDLRPGRAVPADRGETVAEFGDLVIADART